MSEVKLVLTDIDGTLVWHGQHNPSVAVRKAIDDVQSAGIELTAATGRPYEMMQPLFEQIGFRGLGIFDAGASIRNVHTGELAWSNWLDPERVRTLAELLLPHATIIDFFPTYQEIPPEEADLGDVESAPYVFAFVKDRHRGTIVEALEHMLDVTYHIGVGNPERPGEFDIQITDVNSDKFHAVNALRKLVHSDKDQTLAIGDSTNDRPLFMNAGIKVAMGNAMGELKTEADHIVGDVDHDGFAEAMQRFVLSR